MTETNLTGGPLFAALAMSVYGVHWKAEFGAALGGVSERTIRRWGAGTDTPPLGVQEKLRAFAKDRVVAINAMLALSEAEAAIAAAALPQPVPVPVPEVEDASQD